MKTISLILFGAAVIQIASCVPTTTMTPLGGMNMDQLVEHYMQQKFHRYDVSLSAVRAVCQSWVERVDRFIANPPQHRRKDLAIAGEIKGYLQDFLAETKNDHYVKQCGLEKIVMYYHRIIRALAKNDAMRDSFKEFTNDLTTAMGDRHGDETYDSILDNRSLDLNEHVKFSTACCKYFKNSLDLIEGRCH